MLAGTVLLKAAFATAVLERVLVVVDHELAAYN